MYLYRFEVSAGREVIPVVIAAPGEEEAFRLVEDELEKHFLKVPPVHDVVLYEKKRIVKGTGFVLDAREKTSSRAVQGAQPAGSDPTPSVPEGC